MWTTATRRLALAIAFVVTVALCVWASVTLAATTGVSTDQARTAAPAAVSVTGTAADEGTSRSFSRADHNHAITGTLPQDNGGTGSGVLTCSAGQHLTSDGSVFTCEDGASSATGGPVQVRFTGVNVNRAQSILMRAVLRSRHTMSGETVWDPGAPNYSPYTFLRDTYMASAALPGYFDASVLGPYLDLFFDTIGGDAVDATQAAQHFILATATPQYREGLNNVGYRPTYDTAAYMILTTAQVYRRGDPTIFDTRKAALKAMFESVPRASSGLLWSDPAQESCGWGFESGAQVNGELGMASALYAQAAREMVAMAKEQGDAATAVAFQAHYDSLVAGLRTLRRTDHFYKPSSNLDRHHTMLTSLMVAEGLIEDPSERALTAVALKNAALAGRFLSPTSAMRHLFVGEIFPDYLGPEEAQNGSYWHGQWVGWLAKAMVVAGDNLLAQKTIQAAVTRINTYHDAAGTGPCEYETLEAVCIGQAYSMAAAGFLEVISDQKAAGSYKLATDTGPATLTPRGFTLDDGGVTGLISEEDLSTLTGTIVMRGPDGSTVDSISSTDVVIEEDVALQNVASESTVTYSRMNVEGRVTDQMTIGATNGGLKIEGDGSIDIVASTGTLSVGPASLSYNDGATSYDLLLAPPVPGGLAGTEIQFNDGGTFGGAPNVKWNGSTLLVGPGATGGGQVDMAVTSDNTVDFWTGRLIAGSAGTNTNGVVFLMGQVNTGTAYEAWLGAHNYNLTAWAPFRINPDGPAAIYLGAFNQSRANGPLLTIDNNSNTSTFVGTVAVPDASFTISKLSATGTPSASTYLRGDGSWQSPPGGGSAHIITDEGGAGLTAQPTLNFVGDLVTAADDGANSRTNVTVSNPALNQIGNPTADKTFTMANRTLVFDYTAPAGGDGAFEITATGGFSGDLLHVHQHTGNPGAGTDLVHAEWADTDVTGLRLTGPSAVAQAATITGAVDVTGDVAATSFTGPLTGNASTATALSTAGSANQFWKNGNVWGQPAFSDLSGTATAGQLPGATGAAQGAIILTGDLGGTAASPSVVDDSHAHTATTISGLGVADFAANQGTTTQVLHGNASGQPSWGAIVAADLPAASTTLGAVKMAAACSAGNHVSSIGAGGELTCSADSGGSAYATVQDEGGALTARTVLNFTGTGVACADDTTRTTCTINAGAASAGGNAGEVQYNSAGSLAGAANVEISAAGNLNLVATTTPATPAAGIGTLYTKQRAGRTIPAIVSPDGTVQTLQEAIFSNYVQMMLPNTGTTVPLAFGTTWTGRASTGTLSNPAPATTNRYTKMRRMEYASGTTAGQGYGIQSGFNAVHFGNAADNGGFFFFVRFGFSAYTSAARLLLGFSTQNAALGATEPSTINNTIGLCKDSGDSVVAFCSRNGSTTTKTGSFTPSTATIYDFTMSVPPNSTTVTYRLVDETNGTVIFDNLTTSTTIPAVNTLLYTWSWIGTSSTANQALGISKLYVASDF
jgi:hypothetical protein